MNNTMAGVDLAKDVGHQTTGSNRETNVATILDEFLPDLVIQYAEIKRCLVNCRILHNLPA